MKTLSDVFFFFPQKSSLWNYLLTKDDNKSGVKATVMSREEMFSSIIQIREVTAEKEKVPCLTWGKLEWRAESSILSDHNWSRNQKPFHKWGHRCLGLCDQFVGWWPVDRWRMSNSVLLNTKLCIHVPTQQSGSCLSLETTKRSPETAFYMDRQHGFWNLKRFHSNLVAVHFLHYCTFDLGALNMRGVW